MFANQATNYTASTSSIDSLSILLLVGVCVVFLILVTVLIRRNGVFKKANLSRSLDLAFLEIMVPKETSEDKFGQESTKQNEKELISIGEQLLATLYFPQGSWWKRFWYGQDSFSLEIAAFHKKIHFFITCPRRMVSVVERQIHAQYPKAAVEETQPYNLFRKGSAIAAAQIGLQKKHVYPIKTYEEQNSDPLNAITNAMSKLVTGESMAVQVSIAPAPENWGSFPRRLAEQIQQGKRPKDVDIGRMEKLGRGLGKALKESIYDTGKKNKQKVLNGEDGTINLTPMQQEIVKRFEEKASKTGYYANIRMLAVSESQQMAETHLNGLISSLTQYNMPPFNGFKVVGRQPKKIVKDFILRNFNKTSVLLNTAELTSIWHLPSRFTETPNINWLTSRKSPPPVNLPEDGLLLGVNEFRGVKTEIRLMQNDRLRHVYIIGRTGTGKTEVMKTMAAQDIKEGRGLCIIDPHGEFVEDILEVIPKNRADDVIVFDPSDMERPLGLNMLDMRNEAQRDFVVQEMLAIFEKLFPPEVIGPMFEHNMRNVMLTLTADPSDPGTLVEIPRMFTDTQFQNYYVRRVTDPTVRSFWEQEMAKTSDFHKSEMLGYLVSKVGRFVENTMMRNIIGQKRSSFDFREIMDSGKILLVNLSKGKIGEINSKLLGLIIVSKLQMAALSRANVGEDKRSDFYLYVDEFQNFVTDSFATILSEARKYHLGLVLAHQYLGQLSVEKPGSSTQDTKVRDAVFGNVGTMIAFRVGVEDAEVIAREMAPVFSEYDVVNVERFNAYVKLMINNTISRPFSMKTLPLTKSNQAGVAQTIKEMSRLKYGRTRNLVETEILERSQISNISLEPKDRPYEVRK